MNYFERIFRLLKTIPSNAKQILTQFLAVQSYLVPEWPLNAKVADGDKFDFIIVGAGSAGAVLANRLTENPKWNVLLIEAGGDPPLASVVPGLVSELIHTKSDWNFYSVNDNFSAQAQKDPGRIAITSGKMLGGGSSINYMLYVRGNPADYNGWADAGFDGWDWNTVLPYFKKSENMLDASLVNDIAHSRYHNTKGPMMVTRPKRAKYFEDKLDSLLQSFQEIGIKTLLDYNGPDQIGISKAYFTHSDPPISKRSSTAQSFLAPIKDRSNLHVLKNSFVTKVLISKSRTAVGLKVIAGGKNKYLFARNEVILSAGAINTPKILMSSGIGSEPDLEYLGIKVQSDLPVGKNMQDHLYVPIIIAGKKESNTTAKYNDPLNVFHYSGNPSLCGFFSLDSNNRPDLQLMPNYFTVASSNIFGVCYSTYKSKICEPVIKTNEEREMFLIDVILLHPKSTGMVKLASAKPLEDPKIYTGYFSNLDDLTTLRKGIQRIVNLIDTPYFKSAGAFLLKLNVPQCSNFQFMSDKYWNCYILSMGTTVYHQAGTCPMGKVVDKNLKVLGIKSLRVVDASVFPTMPSANINAPVIMVAERAADIIKKRFKNK